MYHHIEIRTTILVDLETSPRQRMKRLQLRQGDRVYAELVPSVLESVQGPIEVADLHLRDGSVVRQVPYARFRFMDSEAS